MKQNPHIVIDPSNDTVVRVFRGHPAHSFEKAAKYAQERADLLGRQLLVVAHPYVPQGFKQGVQVSPLFYHYKPYVVEPSRNPLTPAEAQVVDEMGVKAFDAAKEHERMGHPITAAMKRGQGGAYRYIATRYRRGARRNPLSYADGEGPDVSRSLTATPSRPGRKLHVTLRHGNLARTVSADRVDIEDARRNPRSCRNPLALTNPMKLLTQADRRRLPPLRSQENKGEDAIAYVKFFTPWSNWTWYATEFDGDDTFFGLVQGHEEELGYFSLSELASVRGRFGLGIERDLYFRPTRIGDLRKRSNPLTRAERKGFLAEAKRSMDLARADERDGHQMAAEYWKGRVSGLSHAALSNPSRERYEVFFRSGGEQWHSGPFPCKGKAEEYAKRYQRGWKGSSPVRYKVIPYSVWYGPESAEHPERSRMWNPGRNRFRIGDVVIVSEGSGLKSGTVAKVVRPFDWRKEEGAYKPVPRGYVYLQTLTPGRSEDPKSGGELFTMPANRLSHHSRPNPSKGRYIRERQRPPSEFDPRSIRTITRGGKKIVIGCPKGHWDPKRKRCRVGTRAQSILHPMKKKYIGKRNPATPAFAKKIVQQKLSALKLPAYKLTARTIGFSDLARGQRVFVKIHGWKPDARARELEKVAMAHGFSIDFGGVGNPGFTIGRGRTERKLTPAQARRMMKKNPILQTVGLNPPKNGVKKPPFKNGQKVPVEKARKWVHSTGNRELIAQFEKAYKLQCKANRPPKYVVMRNIPIGSSRKVDDVMALVEYGRTEETRYVPPKGSKKGRHLYEHKWGEKGGKRSVPLLATPDGKALVMPLGKGKIASDWLRG